MGTKMVMKFYFLMSRIIDENYFLREKKAPLKRSRSGSDILCPKHRMTIKVIINNI